MAVFNSALGRLFQGFKTDYSKGNKIMPGNYCAEAQILAANYCLWLIRLLHQIFLAQFPDFVTKYRLIVIYL
jgi:hypothetical protein